MAHSTPTRASEARETPRPSFQSPTLPNLSDFLYESRNSPEAHKRAQEEAEKDQKRVLEDAIHVFELHRIAEETRRIEEQQKRDRELAKAEEERVREERRKEVQRLEDEAKIQALKQKPIPKPTPPLPPPEEPKDERPTVINGVKSESPALAPEIKLPSTAPLAASTLGTVAGTVPQGANQSLAQPNLAAVAQVAAATKQQQTPDPYVKVHQRCKELRKFMDQQAKATPALKNVMGDMRREIRKSVGQLTVGGLRDNRVPVTKIVQSLRLSLQQAPSAPIDAAEFVIEPREPIEGAARNEPQLPSLFIYLLNLLSKAVIKQFVDESGASTKTADSIGQVVAKVFSDEEFFWRGKSMIDIIVAKYRVVCPVLFGFRGDEKMEMGRARVGWKKRDGRWITEQEHGERMTGLGAGFAAMTLRDFSKAKKKNPWPPHAYWKALATILNTSPEEISKTQCFVLKSMIADYEQRFIQFYGNAALAALRCALVDFPSRVPEKSSASETLKVQAKTLYRDYGLNLERL